MQRIELTRAQYISLTGHTPAKDCDGVVYYGFEGVPTVEYIFIDDSGWAADVAELERIYALDS